DMGDTAEIQEDIARGIYVADVADGVASGQESLILKKVTDCINRIYGRVRLEHAIEEAYLPAEEKDIRFRFDIPLERLIVFMQHSGSEELYDTYRKRRENMGNSGKTGMEIEIGAPLVPVLLARSYEANFSGRELFPEYEDGTPPYDSKNVKYKELWGKMLSYTKKSPSRSGSEEGELVIPVNSDNRPDVEIYYQPAIKVGLEYIQNGESVQHIEGCLSSAKGETHEEYCLQEGEVTVRIKLLDDYGKELTNVDSGLLYKDKFHVYLKPVDGDEWQVMESTGVDYEFRTYLEQKDYQIKVITPWDEQKTGVLKVQERRKELKILPLETKKIILNESEEGAGLLEIEVLEDGIIPPEETILQMSVECICDDEQLTIVPVESTEQGIWLFRPVLYDPGNHGAPKEVGIHISVSRPYAVGEPETAEMEVTLPVGSYPEDLVVGLESDDVIKVGSLLWPLGTKDVPVSYKCRDVLGEEEKSRVSNQDFQVEPKNMASYILMGEDGDIHIRKSWKWFFKNEESAEVTFHSSYNLWNTQNETDVVLILEFHIIPAWVKYLAGGILLLILLWFLAIRIRNHTYRFIPRFQARLEAQAKKKDFTYNLKQDRRRHRIDPGCDYCFLCYDNGEHVEE
ncbi:MAG: hypothetical protein K2O03_08005, partial [Lachnospiraceae bacterium]|nr:hypothetical protein [Lachnospiraceae bacterium]